MVVAKTSCKSTGQYQTIQWTCVGPLFLAPYPKAVQAIPTPSDLTWTFWYGPLTLKACIVCDILDSANQPFLSLLCLALNTTFRAVHKFSCTQQISPRPHHLQPRPLFHYVESISFEISRSTHIICVSSRPYRSPGPRFCTTIHTTFVSSCAHQPGQHYRVIVFQSSPYSQRLSCHFQSSSMSGPSTKRRKVIPARRITDLEWEIHKPQLKRLYIDEDKTAKQIRAEMLNEHDFNPT